MRNQPNRFGNRFTSNEPYDWGISLLGTSRDSYQSINFHSKVLSPDEQLLRDLNDSKKQLDALKKLKDDFLFMKGQYHFRTLAPKIFSIFANKGSLDQITLSGEVIETALSLDSNNYAVFLNKNILELFFLLQSSST